METPIVAITSMVVRVTIILSVKLSILKANVATPTKLMRNVWMKVFVRWYSNFLLKMAVTLAFE